jgi:hypothetical protein
LSDLAFSTGFCETLFASSEILLSIHPLFRLRIIYSLDSHLDLLFFPPPIGHLAFPEILGDFAFEFVRVCTVDPVPYTGQPCLKARTLGKCSSDLLGAAT